MSRRQSEAGAATVDLRAKLPEPGLAILTAWPA